MKALACDLGHMSFADAYAVQLQTLFAVRAGKLPHTLLFVEHDPVLTLGANSHDDNLLLKPEQYEAEGIAIEKADRGGDVTFHGPRQLVIYPIFDVSQLGKDLHRWLRDLEGAIILALEVLGLEGRRFPPNTGVWIGDKKIAAIGIKVSRWVSMHGIALNCDNDLAPFELIVPCGISDFGVTSLSNETGRRITIEDAKPLVVRAFEKVFGLTFEPATLREIMDEAATTQTLS